MNMTKAIFSGALALSASACATAPSAPRDALAAPFVLEQDLAGENIAHGEFRTITGTRRAFTAMLHGEMQGDVFVLREEFAFEDGERDVKTWRLRQIAPGRFEGTREDVIGVAIGEQDGDYFRLNYNVRLGAQDSGGRVVRFRDILYRNEQGVGNRANVSWHGIRVGSVRLQMQRAP